MPLASLPLAASLLAPVGPDILGRDLRGQPVSIAQDSPTVLVFFSMDCRSCGSEIAELEDYGVHVVNVNVDNASLSSRLGLYASLHELESPLLADADGQLRRRYNLDGQGLVVLDSSGEVLAHRNGPPSQALALIEDTVGGSAVASVTLP